MAEKTQPKENLFFPFVAEYSVLGNNVSLPTQPAGRVISMSNPVIIQGGMGVAVSGWRLARAVAQCGQLGVVSGTALDLLLARAIVANAASPT